MNGVPIIACAYRKWKRQTGVGCDLAYKNLEGTEFELLINFSKLVII